MSYESMERFAKKVAAQERRKCEDEAITKNIVANWHCPDCERNKQRAALWRAEAYKQAGHEFERPWVGLTDEELSEVYNNSNWDFKHSWDYERAIENKLKEKNT